jgi:farnesyl-diphosphate farnesyltransferase
MNDTIVETPSGKGRTDENFPVGSFLIRKELRPRVHAFYAFARNADDIADNPALSPEVKLERLNRMAAILQGSGESGSPTAEALRISLKESGTTAQHSLDLLTAFKQDAVKQRYETWDELYDYCRYSAMPVGRHVLDLHGESRDTWEPSDALTASLQILNHLQDCGKDLQAMDRCYIPEADLARNGSSVKDIKGFMASQGLRRTIDGLLDHVDRLNRIGARLPERVQDKRLKVETAMIVALACRLSKRLRHGDPLATRVKLTKPDFALSLAGSLRWAA